MARKDELKNQYFALSSKEEIGDELSGKINDYIAGIDQFGVYERWYVSYRQYYNIDSLNVGWNLGIRPGGKSGEIQNIKINDYRNLIQHVLTLVTQNRPALNARAVNSDETSQKQAILGTQLLDYYLREKKLERYLKSAVEKALVFGEGFVRLDWNGDIGEDYGVDPTTGKVAKTGDLNFFVHDPNDIIRDPQVRDPEGHNWYIVRDFKNKYDLAAKYPKMKEPIINSVTSEINNLKTWLFFETHVPTDEIDYYIFYHKRTEALPNGRVTKFLASGEVLYDGDLPFKDIPLHRVTPAHQMETVFGYSPAFDVLGIQQAIDRLYTTALTNQSAFGIQSLVIDKGSDVSHKDLAGGLRLIKKNRDFDVKPLQLTSTPQEVFGFMQQLEAKAETLMGINSIIRGNPEKHLDDASGAAMALLADQALKFNAGLQQSWVQLLEDVGSQVISILQLFATTERVASIVGDTNKSYLKAFTNEDLTKIDGVIVDVGNPLANTTSGRLKIASELLQYQAINPKQYVEVMKTGNLDVAIKHIETEETLIAEENEAFLDGRPVVVTDVDDHVQHILSHRGVLSDSNYRFNPEVVQKVLVHIDEHMEALRQTDPAMLAVIGVDPNLIQMLQPIEPELPPEGGGELPPEGVIPGDVPPEELNANREGSELIGDPTELTTGESVNGPALPTNPQTGEQYTGQV